MITRYLIVAISVALLVLAGCTTDQASRTTAPSPSQGTQGMQNMQGMQGNTGGGSSGY
ncbi:MULTISPECIES: hypothetical protein [unclassified Ensifer]|uniref:hypothetical protein n=1 Tax=unclassified Ensifer TaxID=2633371 RepID=UPI001374721A|nr:MULTISPECIES: hypothetical protein [unclassified Ensifer]